MIRTSAEELFQWVAKDGSIVYSNIAPPMAEKKYTRRVVSNEPISLKYPTHQGMTSSKEVDVQNTEAGRLTMREALEKQIKEREKQLRIIEARLKKSPDDPVLRQNLFHRRIHLLEDIRRLDMM